MKQMDGGVCAAKGFQAAGVYCGIRKNKNKKDLALIVSQVRAACACVYTQNLVQGAPITVTKANVADGYASAIICNSGNANTCNANGVEIATQMCALLGEALGISAKDVVVASTGVIGKALDIAPIASGIVPLVAALGDDSNAAAEAIMTTDVHKKEIAFEFAIGGVPCHIGGICKGSGMIQPNMATMLGFITTDAAISPAMLQKALSADILNSFNMVSVDGDTSTNDMVTILANGTAGNKVIAEPNADYDAFCAALSAVTQYLSRSIAADGEGASKLIICKLTGAADKESAIKLSKSVINSPLVKCAMFGADANWGRVLCALGYAGVATDVNQVCVTFHSAAGSVNVCRKGMGVDFSEESAKAVLSEHEITIAITLGDGMAEATAFGCDLTYDYVKINGDYRT
ncbi:Arginine biosynthesis bifunctional protein ArgJ [bioreactor metagenome]|uniref:Arginine biosynthesis bifunctional protein ArgJ n=1 Tax=bioreactor metagenome TaxID=1076179 RepID=A0A645AX92_9ZZZZ|nr:bifunctional glutamate N-acetyltransferase/amino-acid acetyltransferase ArgJ [Christensenella sp.]